LSNIGYTGDAVFTVVFTILRQFFGLHCHGNTGSKSAPADPTNTLHLLITIDSFLSSLTHGPGPHLNSSLDVQSIRKKKKNEKPSSLHRKNMVVWRNLTCINSWQNMFQPIARLSSAFLPAACFSHVQTTCRSIMLLVLSSSEPFPPNHQIGKPFNEMLALSLFRQVSTHTCTDSLTEHFGWWKIAHVLLGSRGRYHWYILIPWETIEWQFCRCESFDIFV
jgi:hypothetical protein